MALQPLKKVTDMPLNAQNQRIISGGYWDFNFATIEGKFNAGITAADLSATAGITGGQIDKTTMGRANVRDDFEMQSLLYWLNL